MDFTNARRSNNKEAQKLVFEVVQVILSFERIFLELSS